MATGWRRAGCVVVAWFPTISPPTLSSLYQTSSTQLVVDRFRPATERKLLLTPSPHPLSMCRWRRCVCQRWKRRIFQDTSQTAVYYYTVSVLTESNTRRHHLSYVASRKSPRLTSTSYIAVHVHTIGHEEASLFFC